MKVLLWYIPLALLVLLLCVLFRRSAYKQCPCFFAYVTFGVIADAARFIISDHPRPYYVTYWVTEAGYDLLGILVMYEVLRLVLGSLARASWTRFVFPLVVIASGALTLARAHAVPTQFGHGVAFYILAGEIAVRFIQVFIFAGMVMLVPLLGLQWRQYAFGTATGFGVYATVSLLINLKLSDFGTRFTFLWDVVSLVAYSIAVLIWIWFFSVPQKVAN
ncbi:MAG TPA: hypothetical protein VFE08_02525, partial [Candidatus Sulfotelmatobacter sp.]|nr:hypothetical protein [Candidatus Sulfotelmatobacter sp.]